MTCLLALVVLAPRTTPIGFEKGLAGVPFKMIVTNGFGSAGIQIGRFQVARWHASWPGKAELIAKLLSGWERPSEYNLTFKRRIREIDQELRLMEGTSDAGNQITTAYLSETPPSDGSIPADWPLPFKKGMHKIIPDLALVRGLSPQRINGTLAPSGDAAEAIYEISVTLDEADRLLKSEFPNAKRAATSNAVTFSRNLRPSGFRWFYSVTVRVREGKTIAAMHWRPAAWDRTDFVERRLGSRSNEKPKIALPKPLGSEFGSARLNANSPLGHMFHWEYTLKSDLQSLCRKLSSFDLKVNERYAYLHLKNVNIFIKPGRIVERKEIPEGWKATADFTGFSDFVVVDTQKYVTVELSEWRPLPGRP